MAKNTSKSPAVQLPDGIELGLNDYPAYWEPVEGQSFTAFIVGIDKRDPDFERILFKATHDVECYKGPKDDQEEVTVHEGETFSCGLYRVFQGLIEQYAMAGIFEKIPVTVTAVEKVKQTGDKAKTYWKFSVRVPVKYEAQFKLATANYTEAKRLSQKSASASVES